MFDNIYLPPVEEVQSWTRAGVINFLQENANEDKLDLDALKLKKNKAKGRRNISITNITKNLLLCSHFMKNFKTIRLSSEDWKGFAQLYARLEKASDFKGAYKFSIGSGLIDLSWSKSVFIDYIEKHKCSANKMLTILATLCNQLWLKMVVVLMISLQLLHQYYANVDELIQDEPQTVHPVHPSFPEVIIDDKPYMVQINSQVSTNLLWEVTLLNEQGPHLTAYVRAVQKHRYSLDIHKLLSEVGYSPKVFTTSAVSGNWI
ncbi:hypothetical protein F8M41_001890 [Gigaspora margarita]|uniref:Uncharacterized protein n=1 Tax=Gigaspora margarita TaxID=4874 RepID=A0A8H3XG57_GIGMA|nr:hypothetical protein F8M41_001890 [Gigaspora margarita]